MVLEEPPNKRRAAVVKYFSTWIVLFLPAELYRLAVKSTAWFWRPLAFLGGDLKQAKNPELFHRKVVGRLWAWTSIGVAVVYLVAFVVMNLAEHAISGENPLLTPIGYLLLIDRQIWPWQICAGLSSLLTIALVYLVNDVSGEYRIAQRQGDAELLQAAELRFHRIELLA